MGLRPHLENWLHSRPTRMHSNKQEVRGNVSFRMRLILALVRFCGTHKELASARESTSSSPQQLQSGELRKLTQFPRLHGKLDVQGHNHSIAGAVHACAAHGALHSLPGQVYPLSWAAAAYLALALDSQYSMRLTSLARSFAHCQPDVPRVGAAPSALPSSSSLSSSTCLSTMPSEQPIVRQGHGFEAPLSPKNTQ
jgi:hypothetical protein